MSVFFLWAAIIGVMVSVFVIFVCVRYLFFLLYKSNRKKRRTKSVVDLNVWEVHYKHLTGDQEGYIYWYECPKCHNRPLRNRYTNEEELSPFCPFCGEPLGFDDEGDE